MNKSYHTSPMPLVLSAIPISKDLKRYYWSKFQYLTKHNGPKYAAEVFKSLRQLLMQYIDCIDRTAHLDEFIEKCPVRKNGWLRKLFAYADTRPHNVLQFLKLYTYVGSPVVTASEAASAMDEELELAQPVDMPATMYFWVFMISHKDLWKHMLADVWKASDPEVFLTKTVSGWDDQYGCPYAPAIAWCNSAKSAQWTLSRLVGKHMGYIEKMQRILTPKLISDGECMDLVSKHLPTHNSYKCWSDRPSPHEFDSTGIPMEGYDPFEEDLMSLLSFTEEWPEVDLVLDCLPDELVDLSSEINGPETGYEMVGHIRQIPKKGTVVRRSIADPNRFLQAGFYPYRKVLRSVSRKIPRNCQFDQSKMDVAIEWSLNHGFAGSVDLHQATDWLPLSWFEKIETMLWQNQLSDLIGSDIFGNSYHPRLEQSRKLFYRTARSCWDNEGYCSRWWRGQPLGTLPSFEILTIEHFVVAETASFFVGLLESPYALLGDDIVFFNQMVRRFYINLMTSSGSPLSLHKSYENRITEFAGKIHIVNQRQAYTPDISDVAWYNLFDYQRSTGVVIRYRDLPKAIKQRIARFSQTYRTLLRPEDLYTAMQVCAGVDPVTQITDVIGELITNFYSAPDTEDQTPVLSKYSFQIAGYVGMYDHEVQLPIKRHKPHWWIKKFRPESTTAIVRKCLQTA